MLFASVCLEDVCSEVVVVSGRQMPQAFLRESFHLPAHHPMQPVPPQRPQREPLALPGPVAWWPAAGSPALTCVRPSCSSPPGLKGQGSSLQSGALGALVWSLFPCGLSSPSHATWAPHKGQHILGGQRGKRKAPEAQPMECVRHLRSMGDVDHGPARTRGGEQEENERPSSCSVMSPTREAPRVREGVLPDRSVPLPPEMPGQAVASLSSLRRDGAWRRVGPNVCGMIGHMMLPQGNRERQIFCS